MSRYEGKPLLRLLECYFLSAIGELQHADEEKLIEMTPKLRDIYGMQGQWQEIIAQVMHFPANIDDEFRRMWKDNQKIAVDNREILVAEDFARMIVDSNFSD
jgi:hypothetical protein